MNDDIYMLPTPLIMFFKAAQEHLSDKGLHANHNCLAIKVTCLHVKILACKMDFIEIITVSCNPGSPFLQMERDVQITVMVSNSRNRHCVENTSLFLLLSM